MKANDNNLIVKIKAGDKQAFEQVFVKFYNALCRYAYDILHSEDDAKDVVAEVFANVWEKHENVNEKLSLSSYLYRSVYNRSLNLIRYRKNKPNTNEEDQSIKTVPIIKEGDKDFPLSQMIQNEKIDMIKSAIDSLPDRCRHIFLLHRKFRYKYSEIAEILDISENTVKAQVQIALKKLREKIFPLKNGENTNNNKIDKKKSIQD